MVKVKRALTTGAPPSPPLTKTKATGAVTAAALTISNSMTKCVKVLRAKQSKAKQSLDQAQARNGLIGAYHEPVIGPCFALLCFARNTLTHFVIAVRA